VEKSRPGQNTPFNSQPRINAPDRDDETSSTQKSKDTAEHTDNDKKTQDKDKKHTDKKKKEPTDVVAAHKKEMKPDQSFKKEKEKIEVPSAKISAAETPKPAKKKEEKKLKADEEELQKNIDKDKKDKRKAKEQNEMSSVLQEMPPQIAQQTQALTSPLTPYLHPDIVPLFEKMIGTILQIQSQGITKTQVLLNSPAFASSIFFGCSILLEKYSTAPDSFNIFLKGSQQAVIMFNDNLEGLMDAFKRGNFNFKVGRIEAQYETLFRRKERAANKDTDTGTKK
ncbi:MAG: hypothetical protein ACD_7C00188G0001, partial [uncultured bacterium]